MSKEKVNVDNYVDRLFHKIKCCKQLNIAQQLNIARQLNTTQQLTKIYTSN